MQINKKLLPIKGHFFLFNAGTAPLVPYLSTYARQLGFSSVTVGLIYTVLPIFGLVAKPLFGVIADKFKIQKFIFILFQLVTIISFSAIYFIPGGKSNLSVELDCDNGVTVLKSCYRNADLIDNCKIGTLGNEKYPAICNMNCNMSSPKMWQTVCEHWHVPQYCYSDVQALRYSVILSNATVKDSCTYLQSKNVTLDGYTYEPHCRIGDGFVDINQPCVLNCKNDKLTSALSETGANMTCVDKLLNLKVCGDDKKIKQLAATELGNCDASCNLSQSWQLMEICDGWEADVTKTCQVKTRAGEELPKNFSFTGIVKASSALTEHECVFVQLKHIELPDGSIHYPNCIAKAQYQMDIDLFHTQCDISCNNSMLNEVFQEAVDSNAVGSSQFTSQFWLFFLMMIISWVGQAVVVTFADAICFNLLGTNVSQYGKQRLWGSVGWGIFSLLTGTLIDVFSDGAYKNYTIAFILMFVFMMGDVIVSCFVKTESTRMSMNILADVGSLLTSLPTFVYMAWTIAVGLCTGLLWNFLFWHLEDIARINCVTESSTDYGKTLQGLVSAIQTFCGEIPFMFLSGMILKKVGHVNMMTIVLMAFGVRFILYSYLSNAWWVLPIEMLQGVTFGMFYPTMTSYANVVAPPGTETTVQGLVGAVFEGVGTSLGSFIGGQLFQKYGGWITFRAFGVGALICCIIHAIVQHLIKHKGAHIGLNQDCTSAIRYEQPYDMVKIINDPLDDLKEQPDWEESLRKT